MKRFRFYQNRPLQINDRFDLDEDLTHRLLQVLRLRDGDHITLFNNDGWEYLSIITLIKRRALQVHILEKHKKENESPLEIHLGQVISKGEKMDFVIQKSTELGVHRITPLFSERSVVHLKHDRLEKKKDHWQKIAIHAAEQCGRAFIPTIETPIPLMEWIATRKEKTCFVLNPEADQSLKQVTLHKPIALLIGPEGGLSETEIESAIARGFMGLRLGPRILRTETAALVALTTLQYQAGDLG